MNLTLREYRLYVSQCAVLEQSVMYHDTEHKNIYYCDGTNLKDILQGKNENPDDTESGENPVADTAIADLAIVY